MTITIDTTQVLAAINLLQQRTTNLQPAFNQIGETIASHITLDLGVGRNPWGTPFVPLKKPRKRQGGGIAGDIPLNDTRKHIYDKITFNADANGVDIGMFENVPIGATHQFGSSGKNIPARPFLPIIGGHVEMPNDWNRNVMRIVFDHFGNLYGRVLNPP
jgi:phage gpG-like protein